MKALIIILAIILFFVLLLSIRFRIEAEYFDEFCLKIKWLFISISIYPLDEKILKLINKMTKDKKPKEAPAEPETQQNLFYLHAKLCGTIQHFFSSRQSCLLLKMWRNTKPTCILNQRF